MIPRPLLASLLLVVARPSLAGGVDISLDGVWEVEEGVDPQAMPERFTHRVAVPGLANQATPPFADVDHYETHEYVHTMKRFGVLPPDAPAEGTGRTAQRRTYLWYARDFACPTKKERAILTVQKAQFGTAVWLNGKACGENQACFTAGHFDVSQAINRAGTNRIVIRIGAHPGALPKEAFWGSDGEKGPWTPGIYDSVSLRLYDGPRIDHVQVAPRIADGSVDVETRLVNHGPAATIELRHEVRPHRTDEAAAPPLQERLALAAGETRLVRHSIRIPNARLWSPADPFLYDLLTATAGDARRTRFGLRELHFDAKTRRAILNGKPCYLNGASITLHRFFGDPLCKAHPWEEPWVRKLLVEIPKRMNWNAFRLCIGPAPQRWLDIADEAGIILQCEFPIWSDRPAWPAGKEVDRPFRHKLWKEEQIAAELQQFVRDNCNHPSVCIWDASNETHWSFLGEKALPAARALDLSGRAWENGYNKPHLPTDPYEIHPYQLHCYIFGKPPYFQMTDLEKVAARPLKGWQADHPAIINEYEWLWLHRDGTPTVLAKKVYDALVGPDATVDERRELYAYLLGGLSEFWRAQRAHAGVQYLAYLDSDLPHAFTCDNFLDPERLELEPRFADYMEQAFKPLGVYLHFWEPKLQPDERRTLKITLVNDTHERARGHLEIGWKSSDGRWLAKAGQPVDVPAMGKAEYQQPIAARGDAGRYQLVAEAHWHGKPQGPTVCRRKVEVAATAQAAATPARAAPVAAVPPAAAEATFQRGRPIWPAGRETEMNLSVGFRAVFDAPAGGARLRIAASPLYRVWLNGQLVGWGPARAAHGFFRIDEWPLETRPKGNVLAVEVAGYNVNSYYLLDQPSFMQAEVVADGAVLAATGDGGFTAKILSHRVQKVQRYSFQRTFIEYYRMNPQSDAWRTDAATVMDAAVSVQAGGGLLPRRAPYPRWAMHAPLATVGEGTIATGPLPAKPWRSRELTGIGPQFKGYLESDLAVVPSLVAQRLKWTAGSDARLPYDGKAVELNTARYRIFDLGINRTGFVAADVQCSEPTTLYLLFDEILTGGDIDFKRLSCVNIVAYELQPGDYRLESIEPYTLRYLKAACLAGRCRVANVRLRELAHPPVAAEFASSDERLNRLFAAGVETFRQNTLDVFMDCPSRERAGWLCDSYFTARVARDLTGETAVEDAFLENYLLPSKFAHLPDGMLPMCYPADHDNGNFIANWALWFVLELEEYAARGGEAARVAALQPRVAALFDYFTRMENSDGLLEKLPGWSFVEWSAANKFVQDVNYPSNMLYAAALAAAGRMYGRTEWQAKAEAIRQTVRRQSFDGQFFVDNALRRDGKLQITKNRSEVCQYFAFYFGVADRRRDAGLWNCLQNEFGPKRKEKGLYPEVHPANSFVGNMLRTELLSAAGRRQQVLDESIDYLLYMADRTGTLWENTTPTASCNHGFASHIVHTLYRDVLGLRAVDTVGKRLTVGFAPLELQSCRGALPTPDGPLRLEWRKNGGAIEYRLQAPPHYHVEIANESGLPLRRLD